MTGAPASLDSRWFDGRSPKPHAVTLRDDRNAGTWYHNLAHYFTIAERIAADGGDVREGMRQWGERLRGKHGLESLRARAEKLAAG